MEIIIPALDSLDQAVESCKRGDACESTLKCYVAVRCKAPSLLVLVDWFLSGLLEL